MSARASVKDGLRLSRQRHGLGRVVDRGFIDGGTEGPIGCFHWIPSPWLVFKADQYMDRCSEYQAGLCFYVHEDDWWYYTGSQKFVFKYPSSGSDQFHQWLWSTQVKSERVKAISQLTVTSQYGYYRGLPSGLIAESKLQSSLGLSLHHTGTFEQLIPSFSQTQGDSLRRQDERFCQINGNLRLGDSYPLRTPPRRLPPSHFGANLYYHLWIPIDEPFDKLERYEWATESEALPVIGYKCHVVEEPDSFCVLSRIFCFYPKHKRAAFLKWSQAKSIEMAKYERERARNLIYQAPTRAVAASFTYIDAVLEPIERSYHWRLSRLNRPALGPPGSNPAHTGQSSSSETTIPGSGGNSLSGCLSTCPVRTDESFADQTSAMDDHRSTGAFGSYLSFYTRPSHPNRSASLGNSLGPSESVPAANYTTQRLLCAGAAIVSSGNPQTGPTAGK